MSCILHVIMTGLFWPHNIKTIWHFGRVTFNQVGHGIYLLLNIYLWLNTISLWLTYDKTLWPCVHTAPGLHCLLFLCTLMTIAWFHKPYKDKMYSIEITITTIFFTAFCCFMNVNKSILCTFHFFILSPSVLPALTHIQNLLTHI